MCTIEELEIGSKVVVCRQQRKHVCQPLQLLSPSTIYNHPRPSPNFLTRFPTTGCFPFHPLSLSASNRNSKKPNPSISEPVVPFPCRSPNAQNTSKVKVRWSKLRTYVRTYQDHCRSHITYSTNAKKKPHTHPASYPTLKTVPGLCFCFCSCFCFSLSSLSFVPGASEGGKKEMMKREGHVGRKAFCPPS